VVNLRTEKKPKPMFEKNNNTVITLWEPVFERVVKVEFRQQGSSYVVSEWTCKVRVGHFFKPDQEKEAEKLYEPLQPGDKVKYIKIKPSGKFINLLSLGPKVGSSFEDPTDFFNEKLFAVCVVEDLYNLDNQFFEDFTREYNKKYNRNLNWKEIKDKVMNFKVGKTNINFSQLGYGYHFLPVDFVLKLFRQGFENFCLVHGLFKPDGFYIHFKDGEKPKNYRELVQKIKEFKGEFNV
jgi:hypothetical protein